jgi:hypothetical protein
MNKEEKNLQELYEESLYKLGREEGKFAGFIGGCLVVLIIWALTFIF